MQTLSFEQFAMSFVHDENPSLLKFAQVLKQIPSMNRNGPWLVGGTIRRLLIAEELTTDFDVMFKNERQFEDFCTAMRERGCETVSESDHQITFKLGEWEIQAIRATYSNTLIQTLNKFDFTICQFGYDGTNLVWGDNSVQHLKEKELVFTQTDDPISTMRRAFKYANQGFRMDNKSISSFLKAVTKNEESLDKAHNKWAKGGPVSDGGHFRFSSSRFTSSFSA